MLHYFHVINDIIMQGSIFLEKYLMYQKPRLFKLKWALLQTYGAISSLSCLRKIKERGDGPLSPKLRGPIFILMG